MDIQLYKKIITFNLSVNLTYPLDILAEIVKYILRILFLLALWSVIIEGSRINLNTQQLFSYFLFSTAISDLNMSDTGSLGRRIRRAISRGGINQILIKPVNIIQYFYASTLGEIGVKFILALISLIIGIMLNPPQTLTSAILFILFLGQSFFIAFAYNIFEGALALNFTEVNGIKNALRHVTRILSGQSIPLTLFPEVIKNILLITPVSLMVFAPINALSQNTLTIEILIQVVVGVFWCISLNYLVIKFWKKV